MARPTALTPAVQQRILDAIRAGMFIERAARYGGIDASTFRRWMEKGAADPADEPVLDKMPLKQLFALAAANDVPTRRRMRRQEVIDVLTNAGVGSWNVYREFRVAVEQADVELEARLIAQWQQTMTGNHTSIKDFMSRRFRETWSPPKTIEVTGAGGGSVQVELHDERALAETVKAYLQGAADAAAAAESEDAPATMD